MLLQGSCKPIRKKAILYLCRQMTVLVGLPSCHECMPLLDLQKHLRIYKTKLTYIKHIRTLLKINSDSWMFYIGMYVRRYSDRDKIVFLVTDIQNNFHVYVPLNMLQGRDFCPLHSSPSHQLSPISYNEIIIKSPLNTFLYNMKQL